MKTITRYSPVLGKTITDRDYAYMREDESGFYVSMHDHVSEMESARARIRELESNKKDSISISTIIAEHVEDALREVVRKTVGEVFKSEFKYNGDPCHSTTDSIINELSVGPGKTVKADFSVYDESKKQKQDFTKANKLTGRAGFTFGNSLVGGSVMAQNLMEFDVAECKSALERKVAVCYYVAGNAFIKGCEYEYEVDELGERIIHIVQDAFVSDLKGECRWDARKVGNFKDANGKLSDSYAIVDSDGVFVAQFYIK